MKKFIVFILSFSLLYVGAQLLSGWLLSVFYVPDITSVDSNIEKEVSFGTSSIVSFLATLVTASLAYLFTQKLFANKSTTS